LIRYNAKSQPAKKFGNQPCNANNKTFSQVLKNKQKNDAFKKIKTNMEDID